MVKGMPEQARPVFHYRMPQAHLSNSTWNILPDWERWLSVERLAADADELTFLYSCVHSLKGSQQLACGAGQSCTADRAAQAAWYASETRALPLPYATSQSVPHVLAK
jgi:hypothetical protein